MWYLVRRHLGFKIDEWEALDWISQRVYLDGLREEFYEDNPDVEVDDNDSWDTLPEGLNVVRVPAGPDD